MLLRVDSISIGSGSYYRAVGATPQQAQNDEGVSGRRVPRQKVECNRSTGSTVPDRMA